MIVRCVNNRLDQIDDNPLREIVSKSVHLNELDLEVGNNYFVYGIVFWEGIPWYYILENDSDDYPVPICAAFFEIASADFSATWRLGWGHNGMAAQILPSEWLDDPRFYEELVGGGTREIETFQRIRHEIDRENSGIP